MNIAVGIDVSKGFSYVSSARYKNDFEDKMVITKPFKINHNRDGINELIRFIDSLDGEARLVCEQTGRYSDALVLEMQQHGFFFACVNPKLIKDYGSDSLHEQKTDKADARKIARFGLERWRGLKEYCPMQNDRECLKIQYRQREIKIKRRTASVNNLISLTDSVFPGVNQLFSKSNNQKGKEKWIDFFSTFWHVDCVRGVSLKEFKERYQKWCKRNEYYYQESKAEKIYAHALKQIVSLPKEQNVKKTIMPAIKQAQNDYCEEAEARQKMIDTARELPEFETVCSMNGVGETLAACLIAEIGDVRRFKNRTAITAFAGVDPHKNESGQSIPKSGRTTKKGSPYLRNTLFLVMENLLLRAPEDDPIYQFLDKKRSEGKSYLVYMTAGANKFLRTYYAIVKNCMKSISEEGGF